MGFNPARAKHQEMERAAVVCLFTVFSCHFQHRPQRENVAFGIIENKYENEAIN